MRQLLLSFVAFSVCVLVHGTAAHGQQNEVLVVGFPKEGRIEADGSGQYADLVRAMLAEVQLPSRFVVMPVMRAIRTFPNGGNVCLVPARFERWKAHLIDMKPEEVIDSEPIDYVTAHIVTRAGEPVITRLEQLKGKRLAHWVGLGVETYVSDIDDLELIKAESEESSIRMLMSGRVDAIWNWIPDAYILYSKLGYGEPNLMEDEPIFGSSTHFMCRRSADTEIFVAELDKVIRRMRDDGRLKDLLGQHARIVGVDIPLKMVEAQ